MTQAAPSVRTSRATLSPIPLVEPVTRTRFPSSLHRDIIEAACGAEQVGGFAMAGRKRDREEPSGEGASGGSAGPSKRGRDGAGNKRIFKCTICGKACSDSSHLTRHMRTHSGDRPYACTTCGQAFSRSGDLARHERTHIGDRPYACTTCGQAFSQSGHLTDHMRTHSGDRPHACTTCGKAFSRSGHLTRHCATVHALEQE
ncbi:hypothetical protein T484DRAFT_1817231 [Baffinella frigidus]|nr:hypothetical protein T484DRAFT_1817231 [Cryptophyta sp. CCMP2293]